jgi:Zn-dependent protease with chaperone function
LSDSPIDPPVETNTPDAAIRPTAPISTVIYFDGTSSRKHEVSLVFGDRCDIVENGQVVASWPYSDIRRADSVNNVVRAWCISAPSLARLNIRDEALAAELIARCPQFDSNEVGSKGLAKIIGWSLAALVSIVMLIMYGVPLIAERLTPLVPQSLEARLGEGVDKQVQVIFAGKVCDNASGRAAFLKLVDTLRQANGMNRSVDAVVIANNTRNAFALPGGKIYVLNGLLQTAENADELAGILAHEMGHVLHRDGLRNLIYTGGTSYLIGLLFGDVTGAGALIFASRTLFDASYTRQAETNADTVAIDTMLKLGRSPKPMGELMFRITGNEADKSISILASHPLTEDRQARLNSFDRPPTGPPILTDSEWASLKAICR